MKKETIKYDWFFWFYHLVIFILAIYGIIGFIFLKFFSQTVFGIVGMILGVIVIIINIIALIQFKKLLTITRVLPILHFVMYGLNLILGLVIASYYMQKKDYTAITFMLTYIILIFNIIRLALSSYVMYMFKKNQIVFSE